MKNTDSGHDCSDTLFKKSPAGFLQISRLSGSNEKKKKKKKKRANFLCDKQRQSAKASVVTFVRIEKPDQIPFIDAFNYLSFNFASHQNVDYIFSFFPIRNNTINYTYIYMSRYYYFSRLLNDDRTSMLVSIPFFYSFNSIPSEFSHHDSRCYLRWQLDDYVFKVYHVYLLTFIHLLGLYIYYY